MSSGSTRYRELFEKNGMSRTQRQVIDWVTPGARVLEIGCSSGYMGRILQDEKGCRVTGVEVDAAAAVEARGLGLQVLVGSLEDRAFRDSIEGPFDVVIAADVLEHLAAPAPVLEQFKRWLAPQGRAIIAVPNIATWQIRRKLFFRGDFRYTETGILDRTHLHHFTWETIHELVRDQGWTIHGTMIEGWNMPGHTLLLDLPARLRSRLADHADRPAPRRELARLGFNLAGTAFGAADRLSNWIVGRWPNLCAPHVALLLTPPST